MRLRSARAPCRNWTPDHGVVVVGVVVVVVVVVIVAVVVVVVLPLETGPVSAKYIAPSYVRTGPTDASMVTG